MYEGDRLVGSVTRREPEWTALDRAETLAFLELDADIGPHGLPMSEATDPANVNAFEAPVAPRMDWATKTLEDAKATYYKRNPNAPREAHIWTVKRKELNS